MSLVIEASSIVSLTLDDEDSNYAEKVLEYIEEQGAVCVPPIFFDELQNVLLVCERRGRIEESVSDAFFQQVSSDLPFQDVVVPERLTVMRLARQTGLSFYDSTYLALAQENGVPLATLDKRLAAAAGSVGVKVFTSQ